MLETNARNDVVFESAVESSDALSSYATNTSDVIMSDRDCLPFPEMEFNFDDLEEILDT